MRRLLLLALALLIVLPPALARAQQSKKVMDLVADLRSKNPKVRLAAAQEIGNLADIKLSLAQSALPNLKTSQRDPDAGVRKAVLEALLKIEKDDKERLTLLTSTMKRDADPGVRMTAVTALGRMGEAAKSTQPLLQEAMRASQAAQRDKDPEGLRKAILTALELTIPDAKNFQPILIDTMRRDPNPGVRASAVNLLARQGAAAKAALPALVEIQRASLAASPTKDQEGLRRAIIQAVPRIAGDPKSSVPVLQDALQRDRDQGVRLSAVRALTRIGPPAKSALPLLMQLQKANAAAKDKDKQFYEEVDRALARIQGMK